MKLPSQKRILREDLKDAPSWVDGLIDPINSFMETTYQALNKNISSENLAEQIKELTVITPSTYPVMDNITFQSSLKTKAIGCVVIQAFIKSTYVPAAGPVYIPWIEENGVIVIYPIKGLEASKTYIIRVSVT